jgi:hypothetical protein
LAKVADIAWKKIIDGRLGKKLNGGDRERGRGGERGGEMGRGEEGGRGGGREREVDGD